MIAPNTYKQFETYIFIQNHPNVIKYIIFQTIKIVQKFIYIMDSILLKLKYLDPKLIIMWVLPKTINV